MIHTVKGFKVVSEAEVDIFLECLCFLRDPMNVDNLISHSSAFSTGCKDDFFFLLHSAQSNSLLCKKTEVDLDSPPGVWTEPCSVLVPGSLMVRNEFDGECENLGTVQTPSWSGSAITLCSYSLFSATLHNTLVQLDHEGLSE